jgi:hypothetical protein
VFIIHDVIGANEGACVNRSGLTLGVPGVLYGQGVTSDTAIYFTNTIGGYNAGAGPQTSVCPIGADFE